MPPSERLEAANEIKRGGNELFAAGLLASEGGEDGSTQFSAAMEVYEKALGAFCWLNNTHEGWRDGRGIRDEDIELVDDTDESTGVEGIDTFKSSCYHNLNLCAMRLKKYSEAVAASTWAIDANPLDHRAMYRRACARVENPSSGAVDMNAAISDLRAAVSNVCGVGGGNGGPCARTQGGRL